MSNFGDANGRHTALDWLRNGGEMGAIMRATDWSKTKLGPPDNWPRSLRTMLGVVLGSRFPMLLWWGPDLLHLYNDAYRPILRDKHPASLAAPAAEVWAEVWNVAGPMAMSVMDGGPATWTEDLQLFINSGGMAEETYFTFSYSPVPGDDGRVGGVLNTVQETTVKVQSERQIRMLHDLAAHAATAKSEDEAYRSVVDVLSANQLDLPFVLIYVNNEQADDARLVGVSGWEDYEGHAKPAHIPIAGEASAACWPLAEVIRTAAHEVVIDNLFERFGPLPMGRWNGRPERAMVLPLSRAGQPTPYAFLVAGVSPHRALDERYRRFFRATADQVMTVIANARAYETEKKRAEALAEIDRAKTAFFSNVSHEFRTPLTLILGPLEEALREQAMSAEQHQRLETVRRNSLRLLKLVNTLLEFSRIEAGRVDAKYEPTDLASYTADLASVFRSAIEKAGLELDVDCPPLMEPVFVDRDMWEKIVLNLLSNAYKFTQRGRITVRQQVVGEHVELAIIDTGTGIQADQLDKVFERFYRIEGAQGRTHEGTGIGLALVQELCKFHGGTVRVQSTQGVGTTFTVSIPLGTQHLSAEKISAAGASAPAVVRSEAFIEETMDSVLPDGEEENDVSAGAGSRLRVLLADDNADMREYVRKLLATRYDVLAVADGQEALSAVRERAPDLVLSDVMMPKLDGFGLLHALRADPKTAVIPVILLSARTGEESRLEGLEAGADDYLIKPFSSRELRARVASNLELARMRKENAAREQQAIDASKLLDAERSANRAKDRFLADLSHELRTPLTPVLLIVSMLELDRQLPAHVREDLRTVRENVQIEVRLINDLLDMTKIIHGKLHMDLRETDVHDMLKSLYENCKARSPARLLLDLKATRCQVRCDPIRLRQVFWNLIENAQKFTDANGSIVIRSSDTGENRIRIEVVDTGMGIDASVLPKLFTAFEQGEIRTLRQHVGLGLGLAIAKNLVEAHGGTISAFSEGTGKGATFTMELLGAVASTHAATTPLSLSLTNKHRLHILVVEDHQPTMEMLTRLLALMGHRVTGAASFAAAVTAAGKRQFDLLLSDLGLPDGSGLDLMRQLRDRYEHKGIALTGYGTAEDIRRSKEAGFAIHLTKPVDLMVLEAAISEVIAFGAAA